MFYDAKNGVLLHKDTQTHYAVFGSGHPPLILIPGLSEGLQPVKDFAVPFSLLYRDFAREHRVYVFGRKDRLPVGCSTRDMARDLKHAMDVLGIQKAHILGISQGGMIAQYLALDYPEAVDKLILAVSAARTGQSTHRLLRRWIHLAEAGQYRQLLIDEAEHSYSPRYLRFYRPLYPFLGLMRKPWEPDRFIIQANACMTHDALDSLSRISCPTLVIGGEWDQIVGPDAARMLADAIPDSRLIVYPGLGHGMFEESKNFIPDVLNFLHQDP